MTVSYVIPVYNKAGFIGDVLGAAEAEYRATGGEIIVIDDGSTDDSLRIIKEFAAGKDFVLWRSKRNGGVASTTNLGFSLASRPLIRFIDGDDMIVPGSTERLCRALAERDAGLAFGRLAAYGAGEKLPAGPPIADVRSWRVEDPLMRVLTTQAFIPSAMLAIREAITGCFPLPETYRTSQDFIMSVRFARRTGFAEIDAVCCWVPREAPGRLSGSKARMFADSTLLLADEWDSSRDGDWPSAYARYATRRMAGRASHYARRHLHCPKSHLAWLAWRKLASYLPFAGANAGTLRRIAATYAEALAAPDAYP